MADVRPVKIAILSCNHGHAKGYYHLANDRPISFGANAGSAHFITVVGFDDMGTDYIYDDVIITSDSADFNDHFQDSYVVYPATAFYRHDTSGNHKMLQQYAVIYGK